MTDGFQVDREWIQRNVADSPIVTQALLATGRRLLPICQRLAASEGASTFADSLHLEVSQRPGTKSPTGLKRPQVKVISGDETALQWEYGTPKTPKRHFFQRAISQL